MSSLDSTIQQMIEDKGEAGGKIVVERKKDEEGRRRRRQGY